MSWYLSSFIKSWHIVSSYILKLVTVCLWDCVDVRVTMYRILLGWINSQFVIRIDHKPFEVFAWKSYAKQENPTLGFIYVRLQMYNRMHCWYYKYMCWFAFKTSRHPDNVTKTSDDLNCEEVEDQTVLDVNDNVYEINVLDSTQFEPKSFASCDLPNDESFEKCDCSDVRKVVLTWIVNKLGMMTFQK